MKSIIKLNNYREKKNIAVKKLKSYEEQHSKVTVKELEVMNKVQQKELKQLRQQVKDTNVRNAYLVTKNFLEKEKNWKEIQRSLQAQITALKTASNEKRELARIKISEQTLLEKTKALEAEIKELKKESSTATIEQLRIELETIKATNVELSSELDGLATSFQEMQDQNIRVSVLNRDLEKANIKLTAESEKCHQRTDLHKQEKESLVKRYEASLEKNQTSLELLKEASERTNIVQKKVELMEDQVTLTTVQLEEYKLKLTQKEESTGYSGDKLGELKRQLSTATETLRSEIKSKDDRERKMSEMKEQIANLKRKMARGFTGAHIEAGLEAELRLMKEKLRCKVCSERDKSVVITKCFHMFCQECIDQNLKVRLRKCPGCGITFARQDVQQIYLT